MTPLINAFGQPIGRVIDGWAPPPRPPREPMLGHYCRVEPLEIERHAADLHAANRTATDPRGMVAAVRRQVASVDKKAPIYHVVTLDQYFAQSVAAPRFVALVIGSFAGLAVLLACLGVYGVMSYIVVQRTYEIGVRMALGAGTGEILRSVLGRGFLLSSLGVLIGIPVSFGFAHLLSSLLYGVRADDAVIVALAPLVLLGVAALASYIPARRAARVDPVIALRCQ